MYRKLNKKEIVVIPPYFFPHWSFHFHIIQVKGDTDNFCPPLAFPSGIFLDATSTHPHIKMSEEVDLKFAKSPKLTCISKDCCTLPVKGVRDLWHSLCLVNTVNYLVIFRKTLWFGLKSLPHIINLQQAMWCNTCISQLKKLTAKFWFHKQQSPEC